MNIKLVSILTLVILFSLSLTTKADTNVLKDTKWYMQTFDWDPDALTKLKKFKKHEHVYLNYIKSKDKSLIYVGSIMLGLLKNSESINTLKTLNEKETGYANAAVIFALCAMKESYNKNYIKLESLGTKVVDVAGARSLASLMITHMLSFLRDPRFPSYVEKLVTDEAFQREAISVAKERYKNYAKNSS